MSNDNEIIVHNSFTALEAAIACVKSQKTASEGYETGLYDFDKGLGWRVNDVQDMMKRAAVVVKVQKETI